MVLLRGDIFGCCDTQYDTDQTAVGTVHMPVNNYLVPLVSCTLTATIVCLDTVLICYCLLDIITSSSYSSEVLRGIVLYIYRFRPTNCNAWFTYPALSASIRPAKY